MTRRHPVRPPRREAGRVPLRVRLLCRGAPGCVSRPSSRPPLCAPSARPGNPGRTLKGTRTGLGHTYRPPTQGSSETSGVPGGHQEGTWLCGKLGGGSGVSRPAQPSLYRSSSLSGRPSVQRRGSSATYVVGWSSQVPSFRSEVLFEVHHERPCLRWWVLRGIRPSKEDSPGRAHVPCTGHGHTRGGGRGETFRRPKSPA